MRKSSTSTCIWFCWAFSPLKCLDRYLATTNLLRNHDGDHAARMARFAIDAIAAAEVKTFMMYFYKSRNNSQLCFQLWQATLIDEEDVQGGNVVIRAGFHCGPVGEFIVLGPAPRLEIVFLYSKKSRDYPYADSCKHCGNQDQKVSFTFYFLLQSQEILAAADFFPKICSFGRYCQYSQ